MSNKEDLIVDDYMFGFYEDAKQAQREIKNANYLNERVESMSVKQIKALYDKMLDEKVFKTPIGWEYLKYLRSLIKEEYKDEVELRPIPIFIRFTASNEDNKDYSHVAKMRINPGKSKEEKANDRFKISLIVNVFLAILIIAMFFITINSSSPNIMNYKQLITNEYASWEQELTQREKAVSQKEAELEDTGSR